MSEVSDYLTVQNWRPNRYRSPDFKPENRIPYYAVDEEGRSIVNPEWLNAPYEEVFVLHPRRAKAINYQGPIKWKNKNNQP